MTIEETESAASPLGASLHDKVVEKEAVLYANFQASPLYRAADHLVFETNAGRVGIAAVQQLYNIADRTIGYTASLMMANYLNHVTDVMDDPAEAKFWATIYVFGLFVALGVFNTLQNSFVTSRIHSTDLFYFQNEDDIEIERLEKQIQAVKWKREQAKQVQGGKKGS